MDELNALNITRLERLARVGASLDDIAAELQIPVGDLQNTFRGELEQSRAQGRNAILEQIYDNAVSGSNLTATSFWIKAQCGWRDTGPSSASTAAVQNIVNISLNGTRPDPPQC